MHEYSLEYYGTCTLVFHLCIVGLYIQQLIVLIFIIIFCRKMGQKFIFKSYVYHMQAQFILIIILAFQNILPHVWMWLEWSVLREAGQENSIAITIDETGWF